MFDSEFNSDEKCTKDKISELRLKHSTTRDTKKVASMDKILFDIKKKFENEEYIRKHSTDDASSILSETGAGELKRPPDSVDRSPKAGAVDPVLEPSPPVTEVKAVEELPVAMETVPQAEPQPNEQQPEAIEKAAEEMVVEAPAPVVTEPVPETIPTKESSEKPVEQPVEQPGEKPVEQLVENVVEQPVGQLVEQPVEQLVEQPVEQAAEETSKAAEEEGAKPVETPPVEQQTDVVQQIEPAEPTVA